MLQGLASILAGIVTKSELSWNLMWGLIWGQNLDQGLDRSEFGVGQGAVYSRLSRETAEATWHFAAIRTRCPLQVYVTLGQDSKWASEAWAGF